MLRTFVREYFLVEVCEAELRRLLRAAAVDMWDTAEYKVSTSRASELLHGLIVHVLRDRLLDKDFDVNFGAMLIIGLAERSAEVGTSEADIIRQSDLISEILITRWQVG